jgi:hypothetical protein
MKRIALLSLAAALSLAACDKAPTAPARPTITGASKELVINRRFPINGTALSDCGREAVLVSGTFQRVLTITNDGAGGFHVNDHFDYIGLQGTGVISGNQYVSQQISTVNFSVPGPTVGFEVTQPLTFTLIGQGTVPNEVLTALIHYTVNANGELTTFVDNFRVKCD